MSGVRHFVSIDDLSLAEILGLFETAKEYAKDLRASSLSCRRLFDERFLNTLVERLEAANEQLAVMS